MLKAIKNTLRPYYYRWYVCRNARLQHERIIKEIRERGYANVVFFASDLAMWRYQGVLNLMLQDGRFHTTVILCPFATYSSDEAVSKMKELRVYFQGLNIKYIDATEIKDISIKKIIDPDILFYPQTYGAIYHSGLDSPHFEDRLLCYCPYGVGTLATTWAFNTKFANVAWKMYYETVLHLKEAKAIAYNRGENVVVVGNTNADRFLYDTHIDIWKPQPTQKKRLIWAPHFSIEQGNLLNRGSFLWLADFMLLMAEKYADQLQIAFKPHPRLLSVLHNHPKWGRDKADAYYEHWASLNNGQLVSGDYVDLFMTSDAMIHDCGSFTVEYLYSQRPVMFVCKEIENNIKQMNDFGRKALALHEIGTCLEDVENFILKVLASEDDNRQAERNNFFEKYLKSSNGSSVADNIYRDIVNSIGF